MITNGGAHSPEKWAVESAAQITDIIVIDENSIVRDKMQYEKVELTDAIETALVDFHQDIQWNERDKLEQEGAEYLNAPNTVNTDHLEQAVAAVQAAADQTMFGPHFRKSEVKDFIWRTLGGHFTTVRHTERSWFADRHPDSEHTKVFRARFS